MYRLERQAAICRSVIRNELVSCTLIISSQAFAYCTCSQFHSCAGFRVEPNITLSLVQSGNFGLKNAFEVDGQVYAQPLYAPGVLVNGVQMSLLVVATMQNSIYVFNAGNIRQVNVLKSTPGASCFS